MCGLVGILALDERSVEASELQHLTDTIIHRGPDDSGVFTEGTIGFGFRRLAILDLTPKGHQPMVSQDGDLVLVFNGEIYNYVELRNELMALGHRFQSSGDSEVLLQAYAEWGVDCLPKLNGMWAFLIYDRRTKTIFGSRDRFGVKPLYWYRTPDTVLFASEIKAIKASRRFGPARTNWQSVTRFLLADRMDETLETFTAGIKQVQPGMAFKIDLQGNIREWQYWSLDAIQPRQFAAPEEEYAEIFEDAVRIRLRSDVPVGVCLSGGLDSTSIICAMARVNPVSNQDGQHPIHAFCYMDPGFDESKYINDTLEQTGAMLHKLKTSPDLLWSKLTKALWYLDEPVHSPVVLIGYELMRMAASNGISVLVNGQGADETNAGYNPYFANYWQSLLRSGHLIRAWKEMSGFAEGQGLELGKLAATQANEFVRNLLRCHPSIRKLAQRRRIEQAPSYKYYNKELIEHFDPYTVEVDTPSLPEILKRSVEKYPLPIFLRVEDRLSMAHSLESRLPFLDYRLVSLLFSLPDKWKLRNYWNKYGLRQAMRNRIPESVRMRVDKMGFGIPLEDWVSGPFYEPLQDLFSSQKMKNRGIYNIEAIRNSLEAHRKGQGGAELGLLRVAQFELWNDTNLAPAD